MIQLYFVKVGVSINSISKAQFIWIHVSDLIMYIFIYPDVVFSYCNNLQIDNARGLCYFGTWDGCEKLVRILNKLFSAK